MTFYAYITSQLRIIIRQEYRQEHRHCKEASHADDQELPKKLTSIHSLYPIPWIRHKNKSWQGFNGPWHGWLLHRLGFLCRISFIIATYRFSVSWILRLRVSAFLLQLAVTVLYILASSVKEPTILSTYFSSS